MAGPSQTASAMGLLDPSRLFGMADSSGTLLGGAGAVSPAAIPPPPSAPPQYGDFASAGFMQRKRATGGFSSTVLTGPKGVTSPAVTAQKTLLGA